ncbi:MAG: DUF4249 family protein [Spirosomataceae bacterium]
MKRALLFLNTLWLLAACDTTSDVLTTDYRPVVEAYLVADHTVSIHISKEIPYGGDTSTGVAEDIDGLTVKITNNAKTYTLKGTGAGIYTSDLVIKTGQTYQLSFDYNGKAISATTLVPSRPVNYKESATSISRAKVDLSGGGFPTGGIGTDETTPITLTWDNPSNDYHFVVVDNIETSPIAIVTLPSTVPVRNFRFRNEPVTGTSAELRPQQFQYFGRHRVVLFKINPDYAALYKTNNTSSQNITTPPTEIQNGLGIFTGVNADTLYLQVRQK